MNLFVKESNMKKISFLLSLCVSIVFAHQANGAINLDRTRVIYDAAERSVSVLAVNATDKPYLLQSWLESSEGDKITGPLVALPPLQRIDPQQKRQIRVSSVGDISGLPQDRESLFYFNVLEIPPKSEFDNVLQITFQSRLKLFYRPKNMVRDQQALWQHKMLMSTQGQNITFENPTPYYIVVSSLSDSLSQGYPGFEELLLPPFSTTAYQAPRAIKQNVYVSYMDDYGGARQLIFNCAQAQCRLLPIQEPKS